MTERLWTSLGLSGITLALYAILFFFPHFFSVFSNSKGVCQFLFNDDIHDEFPFQRSDYLEVVSDRDGNQHAD